MPHTAVLLGRAPELPWPPQEETTQIHPHGGASLDLVGASQSVDGRAAQAKPGASGVGQGPQAGVRVPCLPSCPGPSSALGRNWSALGKEAV